MEDSAQESPDPRKVLNEARLYAGMGRFDRALEKHLWFHQHALDRDTALTGVRLSYALADSVAVGRVYPPALEALIEIRNDCERKLRSEFANRHLFIDYSAINRALNEGGRTYELFKWMDSERPDLAPDLYDIAQNYIVQAEDYSLCNRHLDPPTAMERLRRVLGARRHYAKNGRHAERLNDDWAARSFIRDVLTLVALLVLNDRREEAESTRNEALRDHDTPAFRRYLDRAMTGEVFVPPRQQE